MLTGYVLKFFRAIHHLDDLQAQSAAWFNSERCAIIHEPDPDGLYERRIRVVLKDPLPADPFSLIVGDALYSLRSCLDNFAFVLNGSPVAPQKLAHQSEFPVFGNEDSAGNPIDGAGAHEGRVEKKIEGMSQPAKAVIKSLQPYMRGDGYREDPLWILHSLCNADKHRSIHLVASIFRTLTLGPPSNYRGWKYWSHSGPLKEETVISRYTLIPLDQHLEVEMDIQPTIEVGFADGPAAGQPTIRTLSTIVQYVGMNVITRLEQCLPADHPYFSSPLGSGVAGYFTGERSGPQELP